MDKESIPASNEHIAWYWAVITFLTGTTISLITKLWNRHQKQTDEKEQEDKGTTIEHHRRYTDHEVRIVRLETREYITAIDLRNEVSRAIAEVTKIFREDHRQIREDNKAIIGLVNKIVAALPKRGKRK